MSIVFCRSCKAKITQRDTTCPKCGSPNSKLVPFLLCIVISSAALVLFTAVKHAVNGDDPALAAKQQPAAADSNRSVILRTGLSEED